MIQETQETKDKEPVLHDGISLVWKKFILYYAFSFPIIISKSPQKEGHDILNELILNEMQRFIFPNISMISFSKPLILD